MIRKQDLHILSPGKAPHLVTITYAKPGKLYNNNTGVIHLSGISSIFIKLGRSV